MSTLKTTMVLQKSPPQMLQARWEQRLMTLSVALCAVLKSVELKKTTSPSVKLLPKIVHSILDMLLSNYMTGVLC